MVGPSLDGASASPPRAWTCGCTVFPPALPGVTLPPSAELNPSPTLLPLLRDTIVSEVGASTR